MGQIELKKKNTIPEHFWGMVVLVVVVIGLMADTTRADSNNFYADIKRLENVVIKIHQDYVEEVGSSALVDHAIQGMLDILDPHTTFFQRKDYEELRMHTQGKFGGLGIQIAIREKMLTVMTPISGTPASRAGIQSGDKIVKIDGVSTKGITIEKAVGKLRGEPGRDVTLGIGRKGVHGLVDYVITREIIKIKAVPFWGVLQNDIGYVRLVTFSQESGKEVGQAIKIMEEEGIKGLILDLRHNPGGLLTQAIEVSQHFLDNKSLVVSTRGRLRNQNKEYSANFNPVLDHDIPIVVLVSAASASASEIVAGAIQDWDRGVILGDTTFGKGSVQSVLPLDKDHHLKLTTAFYYTPSGRCINKPENGIPEEEDEEKLSGDKSDSTSDSSAVVVDTMIYKTKGGRVVYGGGGIIPDTIVDMDLPAIIIRAMFLKDAFFKYANSRYPKFSKKGPIDSSFTVNNVIMDDFQTFLDSIKFEYKTYSKVKLEEFKERVGFLPDTASDTTSTDKSKLAYMPKLTDDEKTNIENALNAIEKVLASEEKRQYLENDATVRAYIKEAFLVRSLGQDNKLVHRIKLARDNQVESAISLLINKKEYKKLLNPVKK